MASVSLNLTVDQATVTNDDNVLTGANAPGTGDIEIRVDMSKFTSLEQIWLALEQFDRYIQNAAKGPNAFGVI